MLFRTPTRRVALDAHMWDARKHEWDTSFSVQEKAREDAYSIVGFFAKEVKDSDWIYAPTWWECCDEDLTDFISWWREECETANSGEDGDYLLATEMKDGDYWELCVTPVDEDGDYIDQGGRSEL